MLSQFYFETASFFLNQVTEGLPDNQHSLTYQSVSKACLEFQGTGYTNTFYFL